MAQSTKSTFKSYITQSSRESKKKPTTEGIDTDAHQFFKMELAPDLLPGESVISQADNVLKYTAYSEGKQGMSGKLFVTNFKVSFVTADRSSYELMKTVVRTVGNERLSCCLLFTPFNNSEADDFENLWKLLAHLSTKCSSLHVTNKTVARKELCVGTGVRKPGKRGERVKKEKLHVSQVPGKRQRNKLLDENDIPLTSIDSIYQVNSSGKKKKLTASMTASSSSKLLEIHCKNFQIHTFDFKFSPKPQNKSFVTVLVHHAFVTKDSLLFAYEYGKKAELSERDLVVDIPMFDTIHDWKQELWRCKAEKSWRVADVNMSFDLCPSLPRYFAVPISLFNADLSRAAPQFNHRRLPTWCYTHMNGNSLSRMGAKDENSDQPQFQKLMLDAIKNTGKQRNTPKVIDLSETCPSCKDVQESFSKLKKLCMSNTIQQFVDQDLNWYSSLGDTKWLHLVSQCLKASQDVADFVTKGERTVVIQEANDCDFTCLVSSIVQILLDPYCRTLQGFQALIQKEWVRMGHPFQKYLCLVASSDQEQTPIFLLFLDCVWQLLQQFPAMFEYTETFLTTVWDAAHIGLFDTFLFDSDHQRHIFCKDGKNIREFKLPSVWKWDFQYKSEDISLFRDPLYVLTGDEELKSSLSDIKNLALPGERSQSLRFSDYKRKLTAVYPFINNMEVPKKKEPKDFQQGVITAETLPMLLHLWTQCYLRWQAPAQILSGGTPSQYLQQCHMVEEIIHLHHRAQQLQERKSHQSFRPRSELIFGQNSDKTSQNMTEILRSTFITSSFPFSPGPTMKDQQAMITVMSTPAAYLRNSTLGVDKYIDDE